MGTFIPNLSHHTEPLRAMLKKRQRVSLGRSTNTVLSASQDLNCQSKHHTVEILRQGSAGNSSSGRFSQRAGSLSHTEAQRKGPANRLCQQEPHGRGNEVCQHRTGKLLAIVFACQRFSTYLLGRSFIAGERPQTIGDDCHEEPSECATTSSENAAGITEIRCHHQILTREGNATGRCP